MIIIIIIMRSFAFVATITALLGFFPLTAMAWLSSSSVVTPSRQTVVRQRVPTPLFMSDDGEDGPLQTGVVKWFDTAKGFGFIVPDNGGPDVFVHQTAINVEGFRSLANEEAVEYRVVTDNNGRLKALDVTGPNGSPVQGAPFRPSDDYGSY